MRRRFMLGRQVMRRDCGFALLLGTCLGPAGATDAWIRVNQIGYLPADPKIAVLSSAAPLTGSFRVGDVTADIGSDQGGWGPFQHNYRLDFSALRQPGRYAVRFADIVSPTFAIGDDVYAGVPEKLLDFMRLQRCGDNPVTGRR